jgi:UDP-N-acetyl-D-mannosaminuronate dehydrogenase
MLVIIESTIQPGTTRDVVVPILEKESGLNRSVLCCILARAY